eukprot:jgi/Bigna1/91454/estExt_fgenesh1_pg.C_1010040
MAPVVPNPSSLQLAQSMRVLLVLHFLLAIVGLFFGEKHKNVIFDIFLAGLGFWAVYDKSKGFDPWKVGLYSLISVLLVMQCLQNVYLGQAFTAPGRTPLPLVAPSIRKRVAIGGLAGRTRQVSELQAAAFHIVAVLVSFRLYKSLREQEYLSSHSHQSMQQQQQQAPSWNQKSFDEDGEEEEKLVHDTEMSVVNRKKKVDLEMPSAEG